jgi:DNA-binding transcriptional ArsR family regulator
LSNYIEDLPSRDALTLPRVLHALSDQVRLEIVLKLAAAGELPCGSFEIAMPKSSLSHHFRVLRNSGVVLTRREGKEWVNSLRREDLEARFPGLLDTVIAAARRSKD